MKDYTVWYAKLAEAEEHEARAWESRAEACDSIGRIEEAGRNRRYASNARERASDYRIDGTQRASQKAQQESDDAV